MSMDTRLSKLEAAIIPRRIRYITESTPRHVVEELSKQPNLRVIRVITGVPRQ